jgi:phage protein D
MPQGVAILSGQSPTADPELLGAISVEVHEIMGQPARYALRFAVGPSEDDLTWVSDDRLAPGASLRIQVPNPAGGDVCLVKGTVTGHQLHLVVGGSGSTLEVLGGDAGAAMDLESRIESYSETSASDAVTTVLSRHALVPDVESTSARYTESTWRLVQRGSDLRFVQRLARQYGMCFWVDCDASTGIETGHWKRPALTGTAAHTLVLNGERVNLDALDIRWDVQRPTSATASQLDPGTVEAIESLVSDTPLDLLASEGLGTATGDTRSLRITAPAADSAHLQARAEAAIIDAGWFVQATGEITADALGGVLRLYDLVDLGGAGLRHSGAWLVTGVRHAIDSSGHRMRFELARNAWEA